MRLMQRCHPRQLSQNLIRNAERIAQHKWALPIIGSLEFLGCTILPLPMALVMVALVSAAPKRWPRFAIGATFGSVAGALALYVIGFAFFQSVGQWLITYYGSEAAWTSAVDWYNGWGVLFIVVAGVTTGLFRIASLAAGFTAMNPLTFFAVLALSRLFRWSAECFAIHYVRGRIGTWPEAYLKYATVGAAAAVVAAIIVVVIVS